MQVEIDFEVFKALTALRESESDSYNAVIRRVLGLPAATNVLNALAAFATRMPADGKASALGETEQIRRRRGLFGGSDPKNALAADIVQGGAFAKYLGGIWFGNVHFPDGTRFRATYKGQTYQAEIVEGQWIGTDGKARKSPSDAASAITRTNVNGWRFWHVQLPGDPAWRKLDELKQ